MKNIMHRIMYGFLAILCGFGTIDLFKLVQAFLRTEETGFGSFLYIVGGALFFTIVAVAGIIFTASAIIATIRGK